MHDPHWPSKVNIEDHTEETLLWNVYEIVYFYFIYYLFIYLFILGRTAG
jgi:hypothetical protein